MIKGRLCLKEVRVYVEHCSNSNLPLFHHIKNGFIITIPSVLVTISIFTFCQILTYIL